ncbi:MAG: TrmH family RNA methyltransferase [Planctomycetota bacterium]
MSEPIRSPANPQVKALLRLQKARGRREHGHFLVEGRRAIQAFLDAGWQPQQLWLREELTPPQGWPPVRRCSAAVAQRVSQATTASGYLAVFPLPDGAELAPADGGLLLWGIRDPGNLGSLFRSAVAFRRGRIVLVDCCDPFGGKVVQATAGCLAGLRLWQCDADRALALLAAAPGLALVARDGQALEGIAPEKLWIVVGSEAHGLPAAVISACRYRVTLPMAPEAESLNAAVAGAIVCYARRDDG